MIMQTTSDYVQLQSLISYHPNCRFSVIPIMDDYFKQSDHCKRLCRLQYMYHHEKLLPYSATPIPFQPLHVSLDLSPEYAVMSK